MATENQSEAKWDHHSPKPFIDYYAEQSLSAGTLQRFESIRDSVLSAIEYHLPQGRSLKVADIGCGAGTSCMMWADLGHQVSGLDVNEALIEIGRDRAQKAGYDIDFQLGSATELPWPDASFDVCLAPELLEHVEDYKTCLAEFSRILRPGGFLFITTTNKLCPKQEEFNLPLYSWYPAPLKRRYEQLARTTRPELAGHAQYPAVHWFSFYSLRAELRELGFESFDRFDMLSMKNPQGLARTAIALVRSNFLARWLAHVATPYTLVLGKKAGEL